jgi:two-component system nitrogen regulation response regulator NtrX
MSKGHVLIVDDEKNILDSLEGILTDEGYRVTIAESGSKAMEIIRTELPDLVLLDIWMPDMDGIKALKAIREYRSDLGVIVMSGHGTVETAVKAIKLGALDYIEKPLSLENVLQRIGQGIEQQKFTKKDVKTGKKVLEESEIIGESQGIKEVRALIKEVSGTEPVLIIGEKGTGKELIAKIIHNKSNRKNKPFIELDCSAFKKDEIMNVLFGGQDSKKGSLAERIRLAAGGTLILNEIFHMNLETQEKLFDFLKGDNESPSTMDARIIATTSCDIEELLKKGEILYGLLQLLSKNTIPIPSLRTRRQDIPLLVDCFFKEFSEKYGSNVQEIDNNALECLMSYSWPGNIKELKNILERIVAHSAGERIMIEDIPENIRESSLSVSYEGNEGGVGKGVYHLSSAKKQLGFKKDISGYRDG